MTCASRRSVFTLARSIAREIWTPMLPTGRRCLPLPGVGNRPQERCRTSSLGPLISGGSVRLFLRVGKTTYFRPVAAEDGNFQRPHLLTHRSIDGPKRGSYTQSRQRNSGLRTDP